MSHSLPMDDSWLLIPRNYYHMHGGNSSSYEDRIKMHFWGGKAVVPIDRKRSNIPIVFDSDLTSNLKIMIKYIVYQE